jgi:hypothetical protein
MLKFRESGKFESLLTYQNYYFFSSLDWIINFSDI